MDRFMRKCFMDRKIVQLLLQKMSFNSISKSLKVSKKRIRQIHNMAQKEGYLDKAPLPPYPEKIFDYPEKVINGEISEIDSLLKTKIEWIKERREAGWSLITIWEELPFEIPKASFYRFIKRHQINEDKERGRCRIKIPMEIIHKPAEAMILDWGKLRDVIDPETGKKRTVWFLVGIMGFSRYMTVRLVWDNKTETTLKMIEGMFNEIGGVPQRITSDNPKCFSIEASKYEPLLNPAFERFCDHYGTVPEILPPYSPEKKGKVERVVPYVRRLFEAYGDDWKGIEDAQFYIDQKMKLANKRKHGTTKLRPIDVFLNTEVPLLNDLPQVSFEQEEYHWGNVRKNGLVRFRGKYYSVGKEHSKERVFIIGNEDIIKIYLKGRLLETHRRVNSPHIATSVKDHHKEPYERIIDNGAHYLSHARDIGPDTERLVKEILLQGNGYVDTRKVWGILSLDKSFEKEKINRACKFALDCGQLSYRTVMSFLNLTPNNKEQIPRSSKNKFTRDIREYLKQSVNMH